MKLGDTREEMQQNYSERIKKARKVGKTLAIIGVVSSIISLFWLINLSKTNMLFGTQHLWFISFVFFCPISGYIAGHMYYYGFRRMASWLEDMEKGVGVLAFFCVFGEFGALLAWVVCFSLFFSIGMYIGLYDWIKIHIDGKRYGLKVN